MNLLDRIASAIANPQLRMSADLFEQFAVYSLGDTYPGIVPIRGGSDSGRDAVILGRPSEPAVNVAVTSSRSIKGARANLRSSIAALQRDGIAGSDLVSASLADLNQSQRAKLETIAREAGYSLIAVIDRAYFADRLRRDGEWRSRLLGLPGGPFSLSRTSGFPDVPMGDHGFQPRSDVLETVTKSAADLIVWGAPGVGKSTVLSQVDNLYFVEDRPPADRLQDDIFATEPAYLVVDDAIRRTELVERLLHIRKQEGLNFKLIVVGWPHELSTLRTYVPLAADLQVERMTPTEIAAILRSRGILNPETLARILNQARGRPGWAVRLADLLVRGVEWRSVYSGDALRGEVKKYLRRSGLPDESLHVLAVIGLLGDLSENEVGPLAIQLGMPRTQLARTISDVATGGLLDVGTDRTSRPTYSLAPEILASSIVTEAFFSSDLAPITPRELFEAWPSHRTHIAIRTVQACLSGAESAVAEAHEFFNTVVGSLHPGDSGLLRYYLHVGARESKIVIDTVIASLHSDSAIQFSPLSTPAERIKSLVPYFASAAKVSGAAYAVESFLTLLAKLPESGDVTKTRSAALKEFVADVRGFGPAGQVDIDGMVDVWDLVLNWYSRSGREQSHTEIFIQLLTFLIAPTFDAIWASPESRREISMNSAVLSPSAMATVIDRVWGTFEALDISPVRAQTRLLVAAADAWTRVAKGYTVSYGRTPSKAQAEFATIHSRRLVTYAYKMSEDFPGMRAKLRASAEGLGMNLEEADVTRAVLFARQDDRKGWREWGPARDIELEKLVRPWVNDEPRAVARYLAELKVDLREAGGWHYGAPVDIFFRILATPGVDFRRWIAAASEFSLYPEARPLLEMAAQTGLLDQDTTEALLLAPASRSVTIDAVLRESADEDLRGTIIASLTPDDIHQFELLLHRGLQDYSLVQSLLTHESRAVRAATAAAILVTREDDEPPLPARLAKLWREAILELEIPLSFRLNFEYELWDRLVREYPAEYEALLLGRMLTDAHDHFFWRSLPELADTVWKLPAEAKTRIWLAQPEPQFSDTLLRYLTGSDDEWVEERLLAGDVEPDAVIGSASGFGPSLDIEQLSRLLVSRGVDPERIAATLQYGSHSGEEHEVIDGHLSRLRILAESVEYPLQRVGQAGLAYFEPRYASALAEARRREIEGRI